MAYRDPSWLLHTPLIVIHYYVVCSRFFSRSNAPWLPQAVMRGCGLSAPKKHHAPWYQMRKRTIGKHADGQVDRFRIRQVVRGWARPETNEPDVLRQFVICCTRSATSAYNMPTIMVCIKHLGANWPTGRIVLKFDMRPWGLWLYDCHHIVK